MMPTKFGSLKLGVAFGLFDCTYKTLLCLKYKSQMSLLAQNDQFENILENAHIG